MSIIRGQALPHQRYGDTNRSIDGFTRRRFGPVGFPYDGIPVSGLTQNAINVYTEPSKPLAWCFFVGAIYEDDGSIYNDQAKIIDRQAIQIGVGTDDITAACVFNPASFTVSVFYNTTTTTRKIRFWFAPFSFFDYSGLSTIGL